MSGSFQSRRGSRKPYRTGYKRPSKIRIVIEAIVKYRRPISVVLLLVALFVGYKVIAGSSLFKITNIEIVCTNDKLKADLDKLVQQSTGDMTLLDVNLPELKHKIEAVPLVRSARVSRVLPGTLHIELVERKPAVLVRRGSGSLVWLDSDAIELGDISQFRLGEARSIPPVATGFSEGNRIPAVIAEDKERITTYKEVEAELSQGSPSLWGLIDEVNLSFPSSVGLHLVRPAVTIQVGGSKYRERLERALRILEAIRMGDRALLTRFRVPDPDSLIQDPDSIASIDASREGRIVLSPGAKPRTTRQEPPPAKPKPGKK